MIRFYLFC